MDKQTTNERRQYKYKSAYTYIDNTTDSKDKIVENLYKQKYNDLVGKYDLLAKQYENLKNQYITVLDLAKKNSDAYEYCLTSLEKEIEQLRKTKGEQNDSN